MHSSNINGLFPFIGVSWCLDNETPTVKFVIGLSVIEPYPLLGRTKSHFKGQITNYILSNSLARQWVRKNILVTGPITRPHCIYLNKDNEVVVFVQALNHNLNKFIYFQAFYIFITLHLTSTFKEVILTYFNYLFGHLLNSVRNFVKQQAVNFNGLQKVFSLMN